MHRTADDVEFVDEDGAIASSHAAYYAEGEGREEREIVFSDELGLAIEKLPDGVTAHALWSGI